MTPHQHARVTSALIGVLLSVGAVGAQTVAPPRPVAPPSSDFTTYVEGELVRVSIPSNWRELPGSNAVTFAPEGAYGNAGMRSEAEHVEMFTTLLGDDTLFYVLAVVPLDSVLDYAGTFRRVVGSIEILDCDWCARK